MATLKIIKKHHKHFNNPFPSPPRSIPFIEGSLFFNSHRIPSSQIFPVGNDFQLLWSTRHGGYVSISHKSQPTRVLWSAIPGEAFVSAAMAETEVEESRGSFAINDGKVHVMCDHQTIEDIRVINELDHKKASDLGSLTTGDFKNIHFPVVLIRGSLSSKRKKKKIYESGIYKEINFETKKGPSVSAKYWILFSQKNTNQIGFQVRVGEPKFEIQSRASPTRFGKYQRLRLKLRRVRKRKLGWFRLFTRPRGFAAVASLEETEMKVAELTAFTRICISYSSEVDERFYGFGEQFSHMDFKGKRVPILVQEQGIGRGDQPITFAANLVSYRAGGDSTTTYAPSPFYITSKMRSLYLDGYDYSVFDLTRHDRVQIQV